MAEHVWSVFCRKASIDKFSNQVSLLDVVEQITIEAPSASELAEDGTGFAFHGEIASLWRRSRPDVPEKARCRVSLITPDGSIAARAGLQIDLSSNARVRTILRLEALPFRGEGEYVFVLAVSESYEEPSDFRQIAHIPYELRIQSASGEGEARGESHGSES